MVEGSVAPSSRTPPLDIRNRLLIHAPPKPSPSITSPTFLYDNPTFNFLMKLCVNESNIINLLEIKHETIETKTFKQTV